MELGSKVQLGAGSSALPFHVGVCVFVALRLYMLLLKFFSALCVQWQCQFCSTAVQISTACLGSKHLKWEGKSNPLPRHASAFWQLINLIVGGFKSYFLTVIRSLSLQLSISFFSVAFSYMVSFFPRVCSAKFCLPAFFLGKKKERTDEKDKLSILWFGTIFI